MKVYVVTEGEYSDYHIEQVFINKEKADEFAKYHNMEVEEFDTFDDNYVVPENRFRIITLRYSLIKDAENNYQCVLNNILPATYSEKEYTYNSFTSWGSGFFEIVRSYVEDEMTEKEAIEKTKKVAQDILTEAKYALSLGATVGKLNEILFNEEI